MLLLAEVDDVQAPARRDAADGEIERLAPARDHREAIGEEDAVERRAAEEGLPGRRTRASPLAKANLLRKTGAREVSARGGEHFRRDVDAVVAGLGMGLRGAGRGCGRCRSRSPGRCRQAADRAPRSDGRGQEGSICGSRRRRSAGAGRPGPSARRSKAQRSRALIPRGRRGGSRHRSKSDRWR